MQYCYCQIDFIIIGCGLKVELGCHSIGPVPLLHAVIKYGNIPDQKSGALKFIVSFPPRPLAIERRCAGRKNPLMLDFYHRNVWFPDGGKGRGRFLVAHMCFDSPGKFQNVQKKRMSKL